MDYNKLLYAIQVRNLAHQLLLAKRPETAEFQVGSEHYVNFMKAALAEIKAATQFIDDEARANAGKATVEPLHL